MQLSAWIARTRPPRLALPVRSPTAFNSNVWGSQSKLCARDGRHSGWTPVPIPPEEIRRLNVNNSPVLKSLD